MIIGTFYRKFFISELIKFKCKNDIEPTHCIVNSEIYDRFICELTRESWGYSFDDEDLLYNGVKVRKGTGTQLFYFYKE